MSERPKRVEVEVCHGQSAAVNWNHPERGAGGLTPDSVRVDLCDVRAASGVVLRYDFRRDGWSVRRVVDFVEADGTELGCLADGDEEVAFLPAFHERVPTGEERARLEADS